MNNSNDSDILLIAPGPPRRQKTGAVLRLPLALLSLAAWLEEYSCFKGKIKILDMRLDPLKEEFFIKNHLIGITAMTGPQVYYGLKAAKMAKKVNPDAVIVWGGIHPTLLPEETAQNDYVDIVVIGEGEETFKEIAEAVFSNKPLSDIKGTCYNNSGEIIKEEPRQFVNMDDMPIPAYHLVDMSRYDSILGQFDYQSSRGCPYRCDFCYNMAFSGRKWRSKKPEKVLLELRELHNQYGVKTFAFVDDEFFINRNRVKSITDDLLHNPLPVNFTASCRLDIANNFSAELLGKLRDVGFRNIYFGAESGCDEMLSKMNKGIQVKDIYKGALHVASANIRPILSFMAGFPGETSAQMFETLLLIKDIQHKNKHISINGIFPYSPYPGTIMYEEAVAHGLIAPDSLAKWGNWNFQYAPDNPWLDLKKKKTIQIVFYMIRFQYYLTMYCDRNPGVLKKSAILLLSLPLQISSIIRWRFRWFGWAFEWQLFAFLAKKSFGYL